MEGGAGRGGGGADKTDPVSLALRSFIPSTLTFSGDDLNIESYNSLHTGYRRSSVILILIHVEDWILLLVRHPHPPTLASHLPISLSPTASVILILILTLILDSIAVSVFVVILVEFDKYKY